MRTASGKRSLATVSGVERHSRRRVPGSDGCGSPSLLAPDAITAPDASTARDVTAPDAQNFFFFFFFSPDNIFMIFGVFECVTDSTGDVPLFRRRRDILC